MAWNVVCGVGMGQNLMEALVDGDASTPRLSAIDSKLKLVAV